MGAFWWNGQNWSPAKGGWVYVGDKIFSGPTWKLIYIKIITMGRGCKKKEWGNTQTKGAWYEGAGALLSDWTCRQKWGQGYSENKDKGESIFNSITLLNFLFFLGGYRSNCFIYALWKGGQKVSVCVSPQKRMSYLRQLFNFLIKSPSKCQVGKVWGEIQYGSVERSSKCEVGEGRWERGEGRVEVVAELEMG